jgi:cytochrome b561
MHISRSFSRPVHPAVIRAFHWATLFVLAAAFALILLREGFEAKALRQWTLDAHRWLGLTAWALACARLVVRSRVPLAPTQATAPAWQRWAAAGMHGVLYLLLVGLPLLGWALTNARGQPVPGLAALPAWPARDLDLADTLETLHGTAAWTLLALVSAHAAIALWHHRVVRDDVLTAMWPRLARRH